MKNKKNMKKDKKATLTGWGKRCDGQTQYLSCVHCVCNVGVSIYLISIASSTQLLEHMQANIKNFRNIREPDNQSNPRQSVQTLSSKMLSPRDDEDTLSPLTDTSHAL